MVKRKSTIVIIISTIIMFLAVLLFCGCGNMNYGLGNYTFNYIHIPQNNVCFEINSWHNNNLGVEVHTEQGGMFFAEGTYILVEGDHGHCPICEALGE